MIKVAEILTRVSIMMQDEDFVRWTKDEWYNWINDGAKEIVLRRPAAGAITTSLPLAQGAVQGLPSECQTLMSIVRNLPNGRRISFVEQGRLEDSVPNWYSMKDSDTIKHYCYDDRNPSNFYVYPPAKEGVEVEAVLSMLPELIGSDDDEINLRPEYISPLVSYCMYRGHAKDSEYANGQLAVLHMQAFNEALGANTTMKAATSPTEYKA